MDSQSVINIAMIATPLLLILLVHRFVSRSKRLKNEAALQADHEAATLNMTKRMTETGTDLSVELEQKTPDPDELEDQSVEAQFNQIHEPVASDDEEPNWKRAGLVN